MRLGGLRDLKKDVLVHEDGSRRERNNAGEDQSRN
jgi:hypothetical protein